MCLPAGDVEAGGATSSAAASIRSAAGLSPSAASVETNPSGVRSKSFEPSSRSKAAMRRPTVV